MEGVWRGEVEGEGAEERRYEGGRGGGDYIPIAILTGLAGRASVTDKG